MPDKGRQLQDRASTNYLDPISINYDKYNIVVYSIQRNNYNMI